TPSGIVEEKPKPKPSHDPRIAVYPSSIRQGEPALIVVEGLTSTANISSFTYNGRPLNVFLHEGYASALVGIDLYAPTGAFPLVLKLEDGQEIKGELVVRERPLVTGLYNIPEKLGGNTQESIQTLIASLKAEGKTINS